MGSGTMESYGGTRITVDAQGNLSVPDKPIVCWLEGDGIGPDIWVAAHNVFNAAVEVAYGGSRRIAWKEILAGEKADRECGSYLPLGDP